MMKFEQSPVFHVFRSAQSEAELLTLLRRGEVRVAMQIPPGYSAAVFYRRPAKVKVWVDGSDAVVASQAVQAAQAIGLEQAAQVILPVFNPENQRC